MVFLICFFCISCNAKPLQEASEKELKLVAMTYNIHHGAGADGVVDLSRIANVIMSAQPDLVAIQEVDRFVERTNHMDQAADLAALTAMHMRFGFADTYQGGDFGNLVLSRFPIDTLLLHPLPGPPGETRVLMETQIRVPFNEQEIPVTFMSTHLETIEAPRQAAAQIIKNLIPDNPDHLHILGGDLNATPNAPTLDTLSLRLVNPTKSSHVFTHPALSPERQIDYLLLNGPSAWSVDEVYALNAPISSDHAPLVTVFRYEGKEQ